MDKKIRTPGQARSRQRVATIIETARQLIGEKGVDGVSMREIAQASGVQIGSLYQYFPGKSQLLLTIMQGYYDRLYDETRAILENVNTISELEFASEKALKKYIHTSQSDPALANLWAGLRAVPELVNEDNKDTYRNAELMMKTVIRCLGGLRESEVRPFALYFCHTIGYIIHFAAEINPEHGKAVIRESRKVLRLRLQAFQEISNLRKKRRK
nr:TetR/AcrR family transcriptional regulator [Leptospira johnsonii]